MRNNNEKSTPVHSKDKAARLYFNQNQPFAEIFDFLLYQGKQKIDPSCLSPLDPSELNLNLDEKRRDIIKLYSAKCDEQITYLIFGLEVQSSMDWKMAIRMMVYDAMRYSEQLHQQATRETIKPIISVVINCSDEPWKGPLEIKEMFSGEEEIREKISNYRMNMLDPHKMSEEEMLRFKSDLRSLLGMFKYIHNKEKMIEYIKKSGEIGKEGEVMIKAYFDVEMPKKEEGERQMGSNALLEILEDKKNEGMQIGKAEGQINEKQETAKRMMESGLSDQLISTCCMLSYEEIERIRLQKIMK